MHPHAHKRARQLHGSLQGSLQGSLLGSLHGSLQGSFASFTPLHITSVNAQVLQHKVRCPVFELADSENRVVYSVPRTH